MKNYWTVILIALFALIAGSCASTQTNAPGNTLVFYVAPNGNDAWAGTLAKPSGTNGPFATLLRARDAIRTMKQSGYEEKSFIVYIRKGTYYLNETLVFTPEDSGTPSAPIVYAAYSGEKPVISGGQIIETPIVKDSGNRVKTTIPQVAKGDWFFYQLFVNGERRIRARTPNEGYYKMIGKMRLEGPGHFTYKEGDIKKEWAGRGDVELIGLANWAEIRMPIVEVNEADHTCTLNKQVPPSNWSIEEARYWIENAPDSLDQPGEWRLDQKTGMLSMILKPEDNPAKLQIVAPRLENLIRIQGDPANGKYVTNLQFKGLTFTQSLTPKLQDGYPDTQAAADISGAFQANGAQNCRIEQCRFTQLGNYAVEFAQGCSGNVIIGNEMDELGAGGVKIGEGALREGGSRTHDNQVTDNHIHHIGIIYPAAVGVWVGQSDANLIAHNHIHHTYYTGISVGWTWGYTASGAHHNAIEFNDVHDIGQGVLSDMGGIYTLGGQPGSVIRNNRFYNIDSYSYGGWGIYPDEGSANILIENNVTYRTKSAGFHHHYGKENLIRNNIFAFAKEYQVMRSRAEEHLSFTFEQNIVIFDSGSLLGSNWKENNYKFDNNVYWDLRSKDIKFDQWTFKEWQDKGQDIHSLIADPLFVDALKYDFRLKPESPALKLGFKPIDLSLVGPRKEFGYK